MEDERDPPPAPPPLSKASSTINVAPFSLAHGPIHAPVLGLTNEPSPVPPLLEKVECHGFHVTRARLPSLMINSNTSPLERRLMSPSEVQFFVNSLRSTLSFLEALYVPTIAVIEGAALGGGLEMVLSCDLRICGEDAVFSMPETGLAIIPGAGGTQRLPRVIGKAAAKELIFTGLKVNGKEAMSMGLVNCCAPTGEAYSKAFQIARDINQKGPLSLRMAKRAINEGAELDMSSGLALEEECYQQLLNTKDRLEGLAAFAEKRKPRYIGE